MATGKEFWWTDTVSQLGTTKCKSKIVQMGPDANDRRRWRRYTALHRLRGTAHWAHSQEHPQSAHSLVPCAHFIHTHIGSSSTLVRTPLTVIHMPSMCATSSSWTPLSTSQLSSCLSSSSPSSTSATSSSRSSTRRSWKTCDSATNGSEGTYDILYLPTEQNHPEYPLEEKGHFGGDENSQRRPVPWRKAGCPPDLRTLPGHWEPMIPSRTMPTYSLLVFEITIFRNSIRSATKLSYRWHKSPLVTSWKAWTN